MLQTAGSGWAQNPFNLGHKSLGPLGGSVKSKREKFKFHQREIRSSSRKKGSLHSREYCVYSDSLAQHSRARASSVRRNLNLIANRPSSIESRSASTDAAAAAGVYVRDCTTHDPGQSDAWLHFLDFFWHFSIIAQMNIKK